MINALSKLKPLADIYPRHRFLTTPAELIPYESDALTVFRQRPLAVVLPQTQEEVIQTVTFCSRHQIPFVARGSGTSLSGGSLPVKDGIVIGLNKLNRILRLDPQQRVAVVEPGVINSDLTRAAAQHRLYYAPDPSSQTVCTIGGNIAFNSGGAHCLKHGMTSNHVLGLKVVLPDGTVAQMGGPSLEGIGPDWTGFFVGSEGLFGVALEAVLRLVPKPERYETLLAAYHSLEAAGHAVAEVIAAGFLPGAVEIMDRLAIRAAEAAVHAGYPADAAALLIVELEGESLELEFEIQRLLKVIEATGAFETRVARDEAERARIWKGRKGAFSSVGRLSPDYIVQDGVVPRSRLGEALGAIDALSKQYGIRVANVFHAGDGNLHPLIMFDAATEEGALERAEHLAGEIIDMCIRLGGSITGEHGVGMEKRIYLSRMFSPVDLGVMKRVCREIDPLEISNRGKMFPPDTPIVESRLESPPSSQPAAERIRPRSPQEVQEAVRSHRRLHIRGGGSKGVLSCPETGVPLLEMSGLSGVIEYNPQEFTFSAWTGTPLSEVQGVLQEKGQWLPFDPVLSSRGATLGGTVAAGTSGSRRYRWGGIRDFLIGVRFVDGNGDLVRGGGKVVKNAAGFDLPKLMVGSQGRLAALTELTLKVFPRPEAYATLRAEGSDLDAVIQAMLALASSPLELEALDLDPPGSLWIRLAGRRQTLAGRVERLRRWIAEHTPIEPAEAIIDSAQETESWLEFSEFDWVASEWSLTRIPLYPTIISQLDPQLDRLGARRRYCAAGNFAWVAAPHGSRLDPLLEEHGISGLTLLGPPGPSLRGRASENEFGRRIKHALDPRNIFA